MMSDFSENQIAKVDMDNADELIEDYLHQDPVLETKNSTDRLNSIEMEE